MSRLRLLPLLLLAAALRSDATPADASAPVDPAAASSPADPAAPPDQPRLPVVVEHVTVSASVAREGQDPATFSTLSGEELQARQRGQDLAMLLAETPGAYAYSDAGNGVGYAYLSLRGFDQRRVAVNVNGVPLNGPENRQVYFIDLADFASGLQEIQVQRGTGTALYGSPAVGGVVHLESGALPNERQGQLKLGAGSFGTWRAGLSWAEPLSERWALQARLSHVESDGYRQPAWTRHSLGFLGAQRVGDDSVLRVLVFGGPEKTQLSYYAVPIEYLRGELSGDADADRRQNPMMPGETDDFVQPQVQVLHDWRRGGVLVKNTLYAILGDGAFRQYNADYSYDPETKTWTGEGLTERLRHYSVARRCLIEVAS